MMDIGSLKSKKFIVAVLAAVGMIVNDALGRPISEETIYAALGILGTYIIGQGIADHGSQGAATAVQRALTKGVDAAEAVRGVLGGNAGNHEAYVHDAGDPSDPSWDHTSGMDDVDKPRELNG